MGKSELATRFANSHLHDFSIIWTIRYESEAAVDQGYRDLAQRLKVFIEDRMSTQQIRRKVHGYLDNNSFEKPWLLFLDGVEKQIKQEDLPQRGGMILITARHSFVRTNAREKIKVEEFSKEEGIALLIRITGEEESEEMGHLVEDLGGVPLALNQAAHYINSTPASSVAKYREVYNLAKDPLQGPVSEDDRYQYTLKTVWNITLEKLKKESIKTMSWLEFCAFFGHAEIPVSWLEKWANFLNVKTSKMQESDEILRTLENYSLMTYDKEEKGLFLHKILRAVIQQARLSKDNGTRIQAFFSFVFVASIGNELNIDQFKKEDWKVLNKWEPHALYVVQDESPLPPSLFRGASVFSKLGLLFWQKGKYQEALKYSKKALKVRRQSLGKKHPDVAGSLDNVGMNLYALGEYKKALRCHRKSLAIRQKLYGDEHLDVVASLNNIGINLNALGSYKEALNITREAFNIHKKLLGEERPEITLSLNNLGISLHVLGNYEEALTCYEKALSMKEKLWGDEHLDVALGSDNVGNNLHALRRYEEALTYHKRAFTIRKKILGEEHPDVAASLNNIGMSLHGLENYAEALSSFNTSFAIQSKLIKEGNLKEEHPDIAVSLSNLGMVFYSLRNYNDSLIYHKKALSIRQRCLGERHPSVATSLGNVGSSFYALGEHHEALIFSKAALVLACKAFQQVHPDVIRYLEAVIHILNRLTDQTLIEAAKQELYSLCVEVLGEGHTLVQQLMSAGKKEPWCILM
ncbi:MAG: tetratricopeptide repeat protein [Ignavibacteriae bacterium]|nr:tetratricopeptide repeat protein [Ignavibacteriota bacterium]